MSGRGAESGPQCRDCGAPIRWAKSVSTGKWMPLDYSSDPNGIWRRGIGPNGQHAQRLAGADLAAALADGELLWTQHHATCSARRPHNPCPPGVRDQIDALTPSRRRRRGWV